MRLYPYAMTAKSQTRALVASVVALVAVLIVAVLVVQVREQRAEQAARYEACMDAAGATGISSSVSLNRHATWAARCQEQAGQG